MLFTWQSSLQICLNEKSWDSHLDMNDGDSKLSSMLQDKKNVDTDNTESNHAKLKPVFCTRTEMK